MAVVVSGVWGIQAGSLGVVVLTFSHNIDQVLGALDNFQSVQLPFAAAMALNDVAAEVAAAEEAAIRTQLDRPIGFTQRGIYKTRASKQKQFVEIGVRPIQAGYLVWQVAGGLRGPKRRAIPVPVGIVKNSSGNMSKGAIARLLARPDIFIASAGDSKTSHLAPGIYRRGARGHRKGGVRGRDGGYGTLGDNWQGKGKRRSTLKLMVAFEDSATYQAERLDFFGEGTKRVEKVWREAFERRLAEAIRTAK